MEIAHLTASTFFGGPERQMIGLAKAIPEPYRFTFISFREHNRCQEFLSEVRREGFRAIALENDFPAWNKTISELSDQLKQNQIRILLCHGYKANIIGRIAAHRIGIPAIAVSRGWTAENWKVNLYEWLDFFHLHLMDQVVCVSTGQRKKVERARISKKNVRTIPNAARLGEFRKSTNESEKVPDSLSTSTSLPVSDEHKQKQQSIENKSSRLLDFFPNRESFSKENNKEENNKEENKEDHRSNELIVLAAGRLSPEKGFHILIEAIRLLSDRLGKVRFIIFGEGQERARLENLIQEYNLSSRVVLPGFSRELDQLIPECSMVVIPSFTEGLPNIGLEAASAGKAIVATAVGGNPEIVIDRQTGLLIPPGKPEAMAEAISQLCFDEFLRNRLGEQAQQLMEQRFTFAGQSKAYLSLFEELDTARNTARKKPSGKKIA